MARSVRESTLQERDSSWEKSNHQVEGISIINRRNKYRKSKRFLTLFFFSRRYRERGELVDLLQMQRESVGKRGDLAIS